MSDDADTFFFLNCLKFIFHFMIEHVTFIATIGTKILEYLWFLTPGGSNIIENFIYKNAYKW